MHIPLRQIRLFRDEWFDAWQWLILFFVNYKDLSVREEIRHRLGLIIDRNIKINKLYSNSFRFLIDVKKNSKKFIHIINGKNIYADALYRELFFIWNLMHNWDTKFANIFAPKLNLGFDALIAYPDADPEINSMDGFVGNSGASYTVVRNAATGNEANSSNSSGYIENTYHAAYPYYLARFVALFPTYMIGEQSNISNAILSLYITPSSEMDSGLSTIHILSSAPATNTNLILDDFDSLGTTSFSNISFSSLISGYNDFQLNSSGLFNIDKIGISKFGARLAGDLNNITPTGVNNNLINCADYGISRSPKLTVTYTIPIVLPGNKHNYLNIYRM